MGNKVTFTEVLCYNFVEVNPFFTHFTFYQTHIDLFDFDYLQGKFIKGIKCSNLYVNGTPSLCTVDYEMDINSVDPEALAKLKIDPEERV